MEKYNKKRKCLKCNESIIKDQYISRIDVAKMGISNIAIGLEISDTIKRTCTNCLFSWNELSLDNNKLTKNRYENKKLPN